MGEPDGARDGRAARSGGLLRVALVVLASLLLFSVVGGAFWYEDLRYSRPTPRPPGLVVPPLGSPLPVDAWLREAGVEPSAQPVVVHFFNPDCPCSRFNLDHLHKLRAHFDGRVSFVAAVQAEAADRPAIEARLRELDLAIPYLLDPGGRKAAAAGVYSTPQAVVVDARRRVVYRGNYNTSRYCTDPRTEFVRLALEGLAGEGTAPTPPELPAYGCELPSSRFSLPTN